MGKDRYLSRTVNMLRWLRRRVQRRGLILSYHRIARLDCDPQLLCVSPEKFSCHLRHLRRTCRLISLRQMGQEVAEGSLVHGSISITLDDGYADNLHNAKPLLEKLDVPATVFATAGYIGGDRELPSDALARYLLEPRRLPPMLELNVAGQVFQWQFDDADVPSPGWNLFFTGEMTGRQRCYRDLHQMLRPLDHSGRWQVLQHLAQWAGLPMEARDDRRVLSVDELRKLASGGLVEIGSHGMHHLVLACHDSQTQLADMAVARQRLESWLAAPVDSFAYPYGQAADISSQTLVQVAEAGYTRACTTAGIPVTGKQPPLQLPRLGVGDWNEARFDAWLKRAFRR